jgi:hypothetical protein
VGVLAAILWAAHPLRVEVVSWAASLKDTLSAFGVVAAFALLANGRRGWSALAFLGALLAKATVFPLALLVPVSDALRGRSLRQAVGEAWAFLVPAILVATVAASCHLGSVDAAERTRPGGSLLAAIPSVIFLPWWYLGRLLWPVSPQALYDFQPVRWAEPRFALAVLGWGLVAVWIATRRGEARRFWLAGLVAWWLPFAPVTGLVPLGFPVADRYALFPSLVVAVLLAWALSLLTREQWGPALAVVGVAAIVLAIPNVRRQRDWHDGVTLWESNVTHAPNVWAVRLNLAGAYGQHARWSDAVTELKALRTLAPARTRVIGDLFFALAAQENVPGQKLLQLRERLRAGGYRTEVLLSVADEALTNKAPEAARLLLDEAQKGGARADVEARLAKVEQLKKNYERVLAHARRALEMNAALEGSRIDVVIALTELGRFDEALEASERPARDPRIQAVLMGARGYALYQSGRVEEAQSLLDAARQALKAQAASAPH